MRVVRHKAQNYRRLREGNKNTGQTACGHLRYGKWRLSVALDRVAKAIAEIARKNTQPSFVVACFC